MRRKYPIGAEFTSKGVSFRIWCPSQKKVDLVLENQVISMKREAKGYFSIFIPKVKKGALYQFKVGKALLADPASRCQPFGMEGPSSVIDSHFPWTDHKWPGIVMKGQSIYEIHIGTFTKEGTFVAASRHLKEIAALGVKTILVMPIHTFPGEFGWGYDGVNLFAPMHTYGTPEEVKAFVNKAHRYGLGVILDVVYNHFGPEQNQLIQFSKDYLSPEKGDWGNRVNFDATGVREYCVTNARYWIEEYHFDGLRFDATSWIISKKDPPILSEFSKNARKVKRSVILIAENEPQNSDLLLSFKDKGNQFDGLLNDDFHHSAHVRLTGIREAYYTDYLGAPQEFISLIKYGFLYQGQFYEWQKNVRGIPNLNLLPESLIICLDNHDQIANSRHGKRLSQLSDPGNYRAMVALLILGPNTPVIFQGQEYNAVQPFHFFAELSAQKNKEIAIGRKKFLRQFPRVHNMELYRFPSDINTFTECKINLSEKALNPKTYQFFKSLYHLRNRDPVFSDIQSIDGCVLGTDSFLLRFFGKKEDRLLLINFGHDQLLSPCPHPLIVASRGKKWDLMWASEWEKYGGEGVAHFSEPIRQLLGHSAVVFKPVKE